MYVHTLTPHSDLDDDDADALEGQLEDTVLGASAFNVDHNAEGPAGMVVEDWIPVTMVADDGVEQETITHSIPLEDIDATEMSRRYDLLPTSTLKMSTLERLHKDGDQGRALALLRKKNRLVIDSKYMYDTMDPNLYFKMRQVSFPFTPVSLASATTPERSTWIIGCSLDVNWVSISSYPT